jgi:acetyltransferase
LGRLLLAKLVRYLRERGTAEVVGQCLHENNAMASLARHAGFVVQAEPDSDTMSLRLRLA